MRTSGSWCRAGWWSSTQDGCRETYQAPAAVVVAPGHDGWVEGDESAVLVQFDCGSETVDVLGLPGEHRHD